VRGDRVTLEKGSDGLSVFFSRFELKKENRESALGSAEKEDIEKS
jgi:hypothetical protein